MLIGIFADSHDHLDHIRLAVATFNEAGCELVVFAGDLVSSFAVPPLRALNCRVIACFGDNEGNKAGVLARVAQLFSRRGYNIYSLAVAPTDDPRFSRITVVVDVESAPLEQVVKQLHKLINVIKISELDPRDSVERELMLLTVKADAVRRHQIIELAEMFAGRVEDVGHDEMTISVAEAPERLDDLEELLASYDIVAVQRTGRVALPKLERSATLGSGGRT